MHDELSWQADRSILRRLHHDHPDWNILQLSQATGCSRAWVAKWLKRLANTALDDSLVLKSLPSKRLSQPPPPKTTPLVIERILAIRDKPPENLQRTPGPRTIAYYLARDPVLKAQGITPPSSTATIYQVLLKFGRLGYHHTGSHTPLVLPAPLSCWQLDYKDVVTVKNDPAGKQAHFVEILNMIDVGTSILVDCVAREDFNAQSSLETVIELLRKHGIPQSKV